MRLQVGHQVGHKISKMIYSEILSDISRFLWHFKDFIILECQNAFFQSTKYFRTKFRNFVIWYKMEHFVGWNVTKCNENVLKFGDISDEMLTKSQTQIRVCLFVKSLTHFHISNYEIWNVWRHPIGMF